MFGSAIKIEGTPDFKALAASRLLQIASRVSGMQILESLEASGKHVSIVEATWGKGSYQVPDDDAASRAPGTLLYHEDGTVALDSAGKPFEGTGAGSGSTVGLDTSDVIWNPHSEDEPASNDAALAHELVHADRAAHGEQDLTPDHTFDNAEERAATQGENSYLKESGFKWHRIDHGDTLVPND